MPAPGAQIGRSLIGRFLARLRFPQLFALAAILFLVDLVVPDLVPFLDEVLLGILAVLLGSWEKKGEEPIGKPPMKDVTPKD